MLGFSAGSIRRELITFYDEDILKTEKLGNLLFYKINIKYPFFKELKSIVQKTLGIEGRLKKVLFPLKGIKLAFIHGAFAARPVVSQHTVDVLIIGNPDLFWLKKATQSIEKRIQKKLVISIYSIEDIKRIKGSQKKVLLDM